MHSPSFQQTFREHLAKAAVNGCGSGDMPRPFRKRKPMSAAARKRLQPHSATMGSSPQIVYSCKAHAILVIAGDVSAPSPPRQWRNLLPTLPRHKLGGRRNRQALSHRWGRPSPAPPPLVCLRPLVFHLFACIPPGVVHPHERDWDGVSAGPSKDWDAVPCFRRPLTLRTPTNRL
jgi:hypothetical protein